MEAKEFGEYIRSVRKEKNLTIRQVELYSGVSNSYLSQLENGNRGIPSPDILRKLSKGLKVPYEKLLIKAGYIDNSDRMQVPVSDLEEVLREQPIKYKGEELTPKERKRALEMLRILLENKNSAD